MAQTIEEASSYIVIELDKVKGEWKKPKLASTLTPFRKKYAPQTSPEQFIALAEDGTTKLFGIEVRVATEKDIEALGGDAKITEAANSYLGADDRAKQEKLVAARVIVPFLSEKVESAEDLENQLTAYSLSTSQVMAMAKTVRAEGIEPSKEFVDIYCKLVSDRSKSTKNSRTVAQVRKAWDTDNAATNAK